MRLLVLVVICLPFAVYGQEFESNGDGVYTRKGYKFELSAHKFDTSIVVDPITGEEIPKIRESGDMPSFVNGKKIYPANEITTHAEPYKGAVSLDEYLMGNIKSEIGQLNIPEGVLQVDLRRMIIDETGKLVYYEYHGLKLWQKDGAQRSVNDDTIVPQIRRLLENAPTLKPATLNGKNVAAYLSNGAMYDFKMEISVHTKK